MKYAVIRVSNGSFSVVSEWSDQPEAVVNFHSVCMTLWNAEDVEKACVAIVDEEMIIRKIERIKYPVET